MLDYNEIICTAIDTIASAKIEGLQYDVTKLCLIEDDSKAKQGTYIVSDGSIRFEAFSSDETLKKGNQVQVTIPNGDYNQTKIILGKVVSADTTPFKYVSPLDTMVIITDNIFENETEASLLANNSISDGKDPVSSYVQLYHLTDATNFAGFSRLGISADFSTNFSGFDVVSGIYGIYTRIWTETGVHDFDLSNKDMYGNPYAFEGYFSQEKVFPLIEINNISAIDVYFYQKGDFKDSYGNLIKHTYSLGNGEDFEEIEGSEGETLLPDNLFVKNIKIYLGYDNTEFTDDNLRIFTEDSLTFKYDDIATVRNIGLRWIHKRDDGFFEVLKDEDLKENEFEIKWYQYDESLKQTEDEFAGYGWRRIKSLAEEAADESSLIDTANEELSHFKCRAYLNPKNQKEEFKVVGIQYLSPEVEGEEAGKRKLNSQILTFKNKIQQVNQITKNAVSALQIVCDDGSDGNYFIYDQNGSLINSGDGSGRERFFKVEYKGAEITNSLGRIDYIKWWIPATNSMVLTTEKWNQQNEGKIEEDTPIENGVKYQIITRYPAADGELTSVFQSYAIASQWYQDKANNVIKCVLSVDGVEYEAVKELKFGKAGTNGTNLTFVLQYENGQNAILGEKNAAIIIGAELYDSAGRYIGFTPEEAKEITWKWYRPNKIPEKIKDSYMILEKVGSNNEYKDDEANPLEIKEGSSIQIRYNKDVILENNYYILQAIFSNPDGINLTSYLPIAIKKNDASHIEGAKEVIYNAQGLPSYYSDAYVLYEMSQGFTDVKQSELKENFKFTEDQVKKIESYSAGKVIRACLTADNYIKPNYLDTVIKIIRKIDDEADYVETPCSWEIVSSDDDLKKTIEKEDGKLAFEHGGLIAGYIPTLKKLKNGHFALCASSFYTQGYNDEVCVYAYNEIVDKEGNKTKDILWSQPILIYQSKYDFSMLNDWDGQLEIDEEKGTIISKMLGAGKKNDDNTFSGVLIGDVKGATGNKAMLGGTGVYGMHEGVWSFGLQDDGTAFFGKAGRGQIRLNGNDSTIQSASFNEGEGVGMSIDLDDGIFQINVDGKERIVMSPGFKLNEKGEKVLLDKPYFLVKSNTYIDRRKDDETYTLIKMDNDNYFLQSDEYSNSNGMRIDLKKGSIDIVKTPIEEEGKKDGGQVIISSKDPYFEVQGHRINEDGIILKKSLINMGTEGYFLQSFDYSDNGNTQVKNDKKEFVYQKNNIYISISGGTDSYGNRKLYTNNKNDEGKYIRGNEYPYYTGSLEDTGEYKEAKKAWENIDVKDAPDIKIPTEQELKVQVAQDLYNKEKSYLIPLYEGPGTGLKIDLQSGMINGYNLFLKANESNVEEGKKMRSVIISSADLNNPFQIGDHFKVNWDGYLTCNHFEFLGHGAHKSKGGVINVNDQFVVQPTGNGTWWSGSVGYASRAKTADTADTANAVAGFDAGDIVSRLSALESRFSRHYHSTSSGITGSPIYTGG